MVRENKGETESTWFEFTREAELWTRLYVTKRLERVNFIISLTFIYRISIKSSKGS